MADDLLYSFTALFVVLDPIGTAALFAALTPRAGEAARRRMAVRACLLSAGILYAFALFGEPLLAALGVSLPAFRVGGGILLFLLATDMVFARSTGLRGVTETEDLEALSRDDISVFPLAFPLIAGPGALTTVMLLTGRAGGDPAAVAVVFAVLALALGVTLVLLLHAAQVARLLGVTGANVVSRLLGVILAALAVQFVFDGLAAAYKGVS